MDAHKVDTWLAVNANNFPAEVLPGLRSRLLDADESAWNRISMLQFKSPIVALVLSLVLGELGVDRFYIGDIGLGVGKLLTCGGAGIWQIIDWFLIMGATRNKNLQTLNTMLSL